MNSIFALDDEELEFSDQELSCPFMSEKKNKGKIGKQALEQDTYNVDTLSHLCNSDIQKKTVDNTDIDKTARHIPVYGASQDLRKDNSHKCSSLSIKEFELNGIDLNFDDNDVNLDFLDVVSAKNNNKMADIDSKRTRNENNLLEHKNRLLVGSSRRDDHSIQSKLECPTRQPNIINKCERQHNNFNNTVSDKDNSSVSVQNKDIFYNKKESLLPSIKPLYTKKRKFPGPAGLLPQLANMNQLDGIKEKDLTSQSPFIAKAKKSSSVDILSVSDPEDFRKDFWLKLQNEAIASCRGLIYHSISMIHRKARQNQLNYGKVPLMCALVKSFTTNSTDACIILRDPTGEIKGTIHQQAIEAHQADLCTGAGIVLKQVSVFSPSMRRHYLNITPSNIIHLVNPYPSGEQQSQFSQKSQYYEQNSQLELAPPSQMQTECRKQMDSSNSKSCLIEHEDEGIDDVLCDLDDEEEIFAELDGT